MTYYESSVDYLVDGEPRTLTLIFEGGTTDYYWNSHTARDFYAQRIRDEGGEVVSYGVNSATLDSEGRALLGGKS